MSTEATIDALRTGVYTFPAPGLERDGTQSWDATTAVTVTVSAGDVSGLGWS